MQDILCYTYSMFQFPLLTEKAGEAEENLQKLIISRTKRVLRQNKKQFSLIVNVILLVKYENGHLKNDILYQ